MRKSINASYDEIADVLYLTSGKISLTENSEDEAGLVLRYDVGTQKPIGATIIDFKEYWVPQRQHLIERLASFFRISASQAQKVLHSVQ